MRLERVAVVVLGLYLTGTGVLSLLRGRWSYTDYLGLDVPAPLALATGLLLLVLGVVRWSRVPWEG
jgi:hypothetical protein